MGDPGRGPHRPGGLAVEAADQRLLERGLFVYDALYAWCQQTATTPASGAPA